MRGAYYCSVSNEGRNPRWQKENTMGPKEHALRSNARFNEVLDLFESFLEEAPAYEELCTIEEIAVAFTVDVDELKRIYERITAMSLERDTRR